jgi:hypothetical protein
MSGKEFSAYMEHKAGQYPKIYGFIAQEATEGNKAAAAAAAAAATTTTAKAAATSIKILARCV